MEAEREKQKKQTKQKILTKKIICKVTLLTKEEIYVIVTSSTNNILNCISVDLNQKISFNINEIDELTIEQIN